MSHNFTEDQVREYIYQAGLEKLIKDCPEVNDVTINTEEDFQLWRIIKQKAFSKIARMHVSVRHGNFIASKLKLPTDKASETDILYEIVAKIIGADFLLESDRSFRASVPARGLCWTKNRRR